MDKLNELQSLAELANQLEENGHYVEANTVHKQFIRLAQTKVHKVGPGDSWSLIARANGVSVSALRAANPDMTSTTLYPGDQITIPAPVKETSPLESVQKGLGAISDFFTGKKEQPKPAKSTDYVVSKGDSLSTIARKFGLREPSLIIKLNPGIEKGPLYPGTKLKIPVVKSSIESEYPEMPLT